mmetsp:Transcript_27473/g.75673  ORF Transcript_27473/g.75673 Transcript_27473/m.75673 type:complete len:215 (+) Transcript_27473:557-1201(+)
MYCACGRGHSGRRRVEFAVFSRHGSDMAGSSRGVDIVIAHQGYGGELLLLRLVGHGRRGSILGAGFVVSALLGFGMRALCRCCFLLLFLGTFAWAVRTFGWGFARTTLARRFTARAFDRAFAGATFVRGFAAAAFCRRFAALFRLFRLFATSGRCESLGHFSLFQKCFCGNSPGLQFGFECGHSHGGNIRQRSFVVQIVFLCGNCCGCCSWRCF